MAITLLLTRHGYVEGIKPRRFRGREDIPLGKLGRRQAETTAARIAAGWRPSTVFTSPMSRCIETGQAIANRCGAPHAVLDTLNDLDYGLWQWKTHDEIRRLHPDSYVRWQAAPHLFCFPGGESLQDLIARTAEALRFVLERHQGQTVVLVGHDSVNRAFCLQLLEQPISAYWRLLFDPCGISEIELDNDIVLVRRINETAHLENLEAMSPRQAPMTPTFQE